MKYVEVLSVLPLARRPLMRIILPASWILMLCGASSQLAFAAENVWLDVASSSITNHELRSHVGVLANDMLEGREAGSRGGHAAARYVIKRLEDAALEPSGLNGTFTQRFHGKYQNLLATLEGTDPKLQGEYLVVGAHYDHVGYGTHRNSYGPWGYIHNGADDNASGVAMLLEVIDALTRTEYRPRRSLLFAFWDAEEKGLLGSKHWIKQPTIPLDAVRLAINIDMVGRLTNGRIEVLGTRTGTGLRRLMSATRLSGETWLDYTWKIKNNSDHWTFYKANIPSLCIHTGMHDDYHRPSDDIEKINFDGMCEVSRYLLEQLCELADADHLPAFRAEAHRETPKSQKRMEAPLPPNSSKLASDGGRIRLGLSWRTDKAEPGTVYLTRVIPLSPAASAGLKVHDRIYAVNGESFLGQKDLFVRVQELLDGNVPEIRFEVESRGVVREVVVSFELPTDSPSDSTL